MNEAPATQSLYGHLTAKAKNGQGCASVDDLTRLMGSWSLVLHELEQLEADGKIVRWCVHDGEVGYVLQRPVRPWEGFRFRRVGGE